MSKLDYITSGQFIHDDLLVRVRHLVEKLPELWNRDGHIEPALLTWAGASIPTEEGSHVDDLCVLPLHDIPEACWDQQIRAMVVLTQACGLVLVQQHPEDVQVIFETPNGSQHWFLPLRRHGDKLLMEAPHVTTNAPALGILWKKVWN